MLLQGSLTFYRALVCVQDMYCIGVFSFHLIPFCLIQIHLIPFCLILGLGFGLGLRWGLGLGLGLRYALRHDALRTSVTTLFTLCTFFLVVNTGTTPSRFFSNRLRNLAFFFVPGVNRASPISTRAKTVDFPGCGVSTQSADTSCYPAKIWRVERRLNTGHEKER